MRIGNRLGGAVFWAIVATAARRPRARMPPNGSSPSPWGVADGSDRRPILRRLCPDDVRWRATDQDDLGEVVSDHRTRRPANDRMARRSGRNQHGWYTFR